MDILASSLWEIESRYNRLVEVSRTRTLTV